MQRLANDVLDYSCPSRAVRAQLSLQEFPGMICLTQFEGACMAGQRVVAAREKGSMHFPEKFPISCPELFEVT